MRLASQEAKLSGDTRRALCRGLQLIQRPPVSFVKGDSDDNTGDKSDVSRHPPPIYTKPYSRSTQRGAPPTFAQIVSVALSLGPAIRQRTRRAVLQPVHQRRHALCQAQRTKYDKFVEGFREFRSRGY
jgi:hypothetical protein